MESYSLLKPPQIFPFKDGVLGAPKNDMYHFNVVFGYFELCKENDYEEMDIPDPSDGALKPTLERMLGYAKAYKARQRSLEAYGALKEEED